ncbi:PH domain-containing protein [Cellulomonas oligotrophica]|uniref:Putative membrane protein n=1 Tax=Cellulomonas oligotrophica TaxID=931536 RepID=A0A7Y9JYT5_9CELL|nr:PH domain-containing protein [Cellulomonas oligotrophica]NYD87137.1 putative membrane protein [Cellulomonas oligotrophica]GIG32077.1 hypothetical protein Col01nite_12360 [Cellulomonas oligotrophica]
MSASVDGPAPAPRPDAGVPPEPTPRAGDVPADAWRRMHPVTPALRGWKVLVAVVAIVGYQAADDLRRAAELLDEGTAWLVLLGALVLVGAVGFLYSLLAWRATRFAVTAEAVHLRHGILFRQQRQARLDRLQAVDVVQPLLARLFGLSQLTLEVAGGSGSAVELAFLREQEATELRAQILALAAGVRQEPVAPAVGPAAPRADAPGGGSADGAGAAGPDGGAVVEGAAHPAAAVPATSATSPVPTLPVFAEAPERQVYDLPTGRLVGSLVRSVPPWFLVVGLVAGGVVVAVTRDVGGVFFAVPAVLGVGGYVWGRVNTAATFRAATSPDGIRLRHGLTETRTQTVPPGRVQAVRLSQGPLWRRSDWWTVEMNVAGYGTGDGTSADQGTVLHPVATRAEAATALWLVLPDLGVDDPLAALDAALGGTGDDGGFTPAPRRARWVDPVSWRSHGVLVTRTALVMRSGRFWRTVVVVPHERTQSLGVGQGPVQRRLGLATFEAHSTPGPIVPTVQHLDAAAVRALLDEQSARARQARRVAGPELWMRAATADLPGVAGAEPPLDVPTAQAAGAPGAASGAVDGLRAAEGADVPEGPR